MERVSVIFLLSFFCLLLYFILHFVTCILRKSVSLSLPLYISSNKHGFLNEMWYKGLMQRILGCSDFFSKNAKDLVMCWT